MSNTVGIYLKKIKFQVQYTFFLNKMPNTICISNIFLFSLIPYAREVSYPIS